MATLHRVRFQPSGAEIVVRVLDQALPVTVTPAFAQVVGQLVAWHRAALPWNLAPVSGGVFAPLTAAGGTTCDSAPLLVTLPDAQVANLVPELLPLLFP